MSSEARTWELRSPAFLRPQGHPPRRARRETFRSRATKTRRECGSSCSHPFESVANVVKLPGSTTGSVIVEMQLTAPAELFAEGAIIPVTGNFDQLESWNGAFHAHPVACEQLVDSPAV